jgi:hypothetical protein
VHRGSDNAASDDVGPDAEQQFRGPTVADPGRRTWPRISRFRGESRFLPDGSALVSERDSHRIVSVDARGQVSEVGFVPGVADDAGEGGLLGIAPSLHSSKTGLCRRT